VFDGHAFKRTPTGEVRPDVSEDGQITPFSRLSRVPRFSAAAAPPIVLSKRANSAKIHAGWGFIWGIPV
jgi:hypothetical protein